MLVKAIGNAPLKHVKNSKYLRTLTQQSSSRKQRSIHNILMNLFTAKLVQNNNMHVK